MNKTFNQPQGGKMQDLQNYKQREKIKFNKQVDQGSHLTKFERRQNFLDCLKIATNHTHVIKTYLSYFISGAYGEGSALALKDVLNSRMNKRAWIFTRTIMIEFPMSLWQACDVWKRLDKKTQAEINDTIDFFLQGDE